MLEYALTLATVRLLAKMDVTTSMAFARKTKVIHRDRSYIRLQGEPCMVESRRKTNFHRNAERGPYRDPDEKDAHFDCHHV